MTLVQNARVARIAPDPRGIDTPQKAVPFAATQPLSLPGWRANALFGSDPNPVSASRLTDGTCIGAETLAEARLFKLTFDEPVMIYAGGLWLACAATASSA